MALKVPVRNSRKPALSAELLYHRKLRAQRIGKPEANIVSIDRDTIGGRYFTRLNGVDDRRRALGRDGVCECELQFTKVSHASARRAFARSASAIKVARAGISASHSITVGLAPNRSTAKSNSRHTSSATGPECVSM